MTNDPKQKADNAANSDGEEEEDVFHDARFPAEEETVSIITSCPSLPAGY